MVYYFTLRAENAFCDRGLGDVVIEGVSDEGTFICCIIQSRGLISWPFFVTQAGPFGGSQGLTEGLLPSRTPSEKWETGGAAPDNDMLRVLWRFSESNCIRILSLLVFYPTGGSFVGGSGNSEKNRDRTERLSPCQSLQILWVHQTQDFSLGYPRPEPARSEPLLRPRDDHKILTSASIFATDRSFHGGQWGGYGGLIHPLRWARLCTFNLVASGGPVGPVYRHSLRSGESRTCEVLYGVFA